MQPCPATIGLSFCMLRVAGVVGVTGWRHSTWAQTYSCTPSLYFEPSRIEDVQKLVKAALNHGTTITVVGARHSPSQLTMTSGWLMSLDRLKAVKNIERSGDYADITVQAGIRLNELNDLLYAEGLSLQNLGSISEQSVAGVISTGTHGSSAYHGLISEHITRMLVVVGSGETVECSDTKNPELFRAALLGLGRFGIIVEATLRVVPAFDLESIQEIVPFEEFLSEKWWPQFFTSAEFHRVWWYPYVGKCIVWRANRTSKPRTKPSYSFYGTRVGRFFYELLLWTSVAISSKLTPFVEKWLFRHQFKPVETAVARSDESINMDCLFKQFVDEWSLPLTNGRDVLLALNDEISKRNFYVHSPFEIRVSNTTLPEKTYFPETATVAGVSGVGPKYGNLTRPYLDPSPHLPWAAPPNVGPENLTLNLNATMYRPFGMNPPTQNWFSCFERICEEAGGRPHWAKNFIGSRVRGGEHDMQGVRLTVDAWYGKDVHEWRKVRAAYDPTDVFGGGAYWMSLNGLD